MIGILTINHNAVLRHAEVAGQAEQIALAHGLLGLARNRCGDEAGRCGKGEQSGNHVCSHLSNLSCGIAGMPEYAGRLAAARLNQS